MAELYLQQGHRDEALKVYQALLAQRPDDAAIRAKVENLTAPPVAPSGPTIRDLLYIIAARRPGHRADAHAGNGAAARAPASGAPQQQTLSADTLGPLFGEGVVSDWDEYSAQTLASAFMHSNGHGDPTAAGIPAHQAAGDLSLNTVFRGDAATGAQQPPSNFSFDQFFSQRATADNPAIPHAEAASESAEDVAHFTQWLEGLKKK